MTILVDMDGVLVDFSGAIRKLFPEEIWEDHFGPSVEKKIAALPDFWENLEWTHDGKELWNALIKLEQTKQLLSAYADWDNTSKRGKMKWIKREIPNFPNKWINLVQRHEKKDFALDLFNSPNILIDDYEKNIQEWADAGGIGILHTSTKNTLSILEMMGFSFN